MADTTFYNRGDAYHDSSGKPAIIKKGNELTFTEHFTAGGGSELTPATANTLGGVKVGNGLNITSDGTLSVAGTAYSLNKYDTGKKWIDGRIIYGKVFSIPVLSATSTPLTVNHNENIDIVTHLHGTAKNNTTGTNFPLPYVAEDSIDNNIRVAVTAKQLSIANAIDRSMLNAYVIIEFVEPAPAETTNNRNVKKSTSKKG